MDIIFPKTAERVRQWASQPEVLGVLLVGSRSQGHADELSDDDLEVVLAEEAHAQLSPVECIDVLVEGEGKDRKIIYDAQYISLAGLQRKAASPFDLDHWPYEHAQVLYERDGSVAAAVEAAGRMDPNFRHKRLVHATIDAWIAPYRAGKAQKRGAEAAARLLVARGVKALSRLVFALEGRWVPLDHWWEAELRTLQDPSDVAPLMVEAMLTGSPAPIEKAMRQLEDRLFEEGVPRPAGRRDLFLEVIHPSRAEERSIHGLH